MSSPVVEIRIVVPRRLYERLAEIAARYGLSMEDLIMRALVRVLEEAG